MLFLIHAYSSRVWKREAGHNLSLSAAAIEHGFQQPEGHAKLIMDGPWILLWPCVLLWPCFEALVGYAFIYSGLGEASQAFASSSLLHSPHPVRLLASYAALVLGMLSSHCFCMTSLWTHLQPVTLQSAFIHDACSWDMAPAGCHTSCHLVTAHPALL